MEKKRLLTLDIVKFICSIFIVFHHFQQETGAVFKNINFYNGTFHFSYLVELFFLISGFLCMYTYKHHKSLTGFLLNKFKRYYPMAILSIVFIYAIECFNYLFFGNAIKNDGLGLWTIFSSVTLIFSQGVTSLDGLAINNPIWYLSVLNLCYIVFYYLNSNIKKDHIFKYILFILLILGLKNIDVNLPFLNAYTFRGYLPFFIGVLVYYLYFYIIENLNIKKIFILLIIAFTFILFLTKVNCDVFYDKSYNILCFIIYPMLLMILLCLENLFNLNFSCNKIGNLSFEIYIWHVPMIHVLFTMQKFNFIGKSYSYIYMIIFALFVVIVSLFIVFFVEDKINCMLKRIYLFFKDN